MSVPVVRVIRDGRPSEVASVDLVPGDVVLVEAGSVVPADLRLVETANLRIQEAALTGESEPVDKKADPIDRDDLSLGDRRCMAYSGTQVTYGRGSGVVVATGMDTELGKIASLLQDVDADHTPLQLRLDRVGKQLALAGLVVAALVVAMGTLAGESITELVLTAISVAVAVIPEGLPAVVTFTLAIGAQRMLRRNALIRKLPAVETLGSVTVICSDKTGTLTQNVMTVTVIDVAGKRLETDEIDRTDDIAVLEAERPAAATTLTAGLLCNDASIELLDDGTRQLLGDPTETAILEAAHRAGIDVTATPPRDPAHGRATLRSERKRMATIHDAIGDRAPSLASLPQDRPVAFVKGAIDGMLDLSSHLQDGAHVTELTRE